MAVFETEPDTKELTKDGEPVEYERLEAVYLKGDERPTYLVGATDTHTTDHYLCIQVMTGGPGNPERETHKIPHENVEMRKYVQKESSSEIDPESNGNLRNTANAEVLE